MRYLRDVFTDYCLFSKPLGKILKHETQQLEPGDVIAVYGDDIVYGIVLGQVGDWFNAIYLTTELVLGGAGYRVAVDHLIDGAKVTPINFYVKPEHCEVVRKLSQDEFKQAVDSFKKLSNRRYSGIWKQFYAFEVQRLQVLYDAFINEMINR